MQDKLVFVVMRSLVLKSHLGLQLLHLLLQTLNATEKLAYHLVVLKCRIHLGCRSLRSKPCLIRHLSWLQLPSAVVVMIEA